MDSETIRLLAEEIINNQILANWKFWAVMIGLWIIGIAISVLLVSYFKEHGKNLATKKDFKDILEQLNSITEVTETIKNHLHHELWIKRERLVIKREKLEELMSYVYDLDIWLDKEKNATFFAGAPNITPNPFHKIEMLGLLYFPELKKQIASLASKQIAYRKWILSGAIYLNKQKSEANPYPVIDDQTVQRYNDIYKDLIAATIEIETGAKEVMNRIIDF